MIDEIWVLGECDDDALRASTLALLSEARELAQRWSCRTALCLVGAGISGQASRLAGGAADKVYAIDDASLATYDLQRYTTAIAATVQRHAPALLMLADGPVGGDLAALIAGRNALPCVTAVKKIAGGRRKLTLTKSVCGELAHAGFEPVAGRTVVVTIAPGDIDVAARSEGPPPEVVRVEVELPAGPSRLRLRRVIKGSPRTLAIEEATSIVAVGRGVPPADLPLLQAFADRIGASLGGSRAAVDAGLVPYERQIGLSGKTVAPKLLIACGISGASQFLAGVDGAERIIALNLDAQAGIFEVADLAIVGDVRQIIPAALHLLGERDGATHAASAAE